MNAKSVGPMTYQKTTIQNGKLITEIDLKLVESRPVVGWDYGPAEVRLYRHERTYYVARFFGADPQAVNVTTKKAEAYHWLADLAIWKEAK